MTALNEHDTASRYADGRTAHDEASTVDVHGPADPPLPRQAGPRDMTDPGHNAHLPIPYYGKRGAA